MFVEELDTDISLEKNADGKKAIIEASKINYIRFKEEALYGDRIYALVYKTAEKHANVLFSMYYDKIITATHVRASITSITHAIVSTLYRRRGSAITEIVTAYAVLLIYEIEKGKRKNTAHDTKDNEAEI